MELTTTIGFKVAMTSLQVAEITGKRHDNVIRDIKDEMSKLGEEISQLIFEECSYLNSNNRKMAMFNLSRDGAMQLGARYDAMTRFKMIQKINELESKIKVDSYMIADPVARAKAWILEEETRVALANKIEQDAPKVEFYDAVECDSDAILVRDFVGLLGINGFGQNQAFRWLRDNKYLMSNAESKNLPYRRYIDNGVFQVRESVLSNGAVILTPLITGKGQVFLSKRIRDFFFQNSNINN